MFQPNKIKNRLLKVVMELSLQRTIGEMSDSDAERLAIEVNHSNVFQNTSPDIEGNYSPDNLTHVDENNNSTYTSWIYIDYGSAPAQSSADPGNISIEVHHISSVGRGDWAPISNENCFNVSIPPGTSGWIPVTVSSGKLY